MRSHSNLTQHAIHTFKAARKRIWRAANLQTEKLSFAAIARLKQRNLQAGHPLFFIDTAAKEHLGQLICNGRIWTQKALQCSDHEFSSWAAGVVIPHGIYDLAINLGHINIGRSRDTSMHTCDEATAIACCLVV